MLQNPSDFRLEDDDQSQHANGDGLTDDGIHHGEIEDITDGNEQQNQHNAAKKQLRPCFYNEFISSINQIRHDENINDGGNIHISNGIQYGIERFHGTPPLLFSADFSQYI